MNLKKATSILLICSLFILIFAIMGCSSRSSSAYLKEIKYFEFQNLIDKKTDFILLVGRKSCPNCVAFEPKLIDIINKYKVTIYKIDTDTYSKEDFKALMNIVSITGTPTVEFYIKGAEASTLNRIVGNTDKNTVIQKLKDNGYIKE